MSITDPARYARITTLELLTSLSGIRNLALSWKQLGVS